MSNGELLLKGIFLGLALAAPVGPIGLLCIQRTLNEGGLAGFISGLGATAADMIVSLFRAKLTPRRMRWVNRIVGIVIVGFGVTALWSWRS